MTAELISWGAVGVILLTSATLLVSRDWRASLGALGAQYLAMFLLVIHHLPFVMGAAKLITGWMVVAVLGMTRLSLSAAREENAGSLASRWFRLTLVGVVAFVTVGATARIESVIPGLGLPVVAGSLLLIGSGVVQLGVTSDLLSAILGLLTVLAGFEITYAAVESSILVAGFLAIINLGLSLAGSYLLVAGSFPNEAEEEES